jgi:hypothetical protein
MRAPARRGFQPVPLDWSALSDGDARLLAGLDILAEDDARVVRNRDGAPAYLSIRHDNRPTFVKLVPGAVAELEARAFALTGELATLGVNVPPPLWRRQVRGGVTAFAYGWVDGEHPSGADLDFRALGRAIAELHEALTKVPGSAAIQSRTANRIAALLPFADLAASPLSGPWRRWEPLATRALQAFDELSASMQAARVSIHGDLNPGNILVSPQGIAFLDLEDATHSALWSGLDLAKIAERLILPQIGDQGTAWASDALVALQKGYGETGAPLAQPPELTFSRALLWHMGLAVAVMRAQAFPDDVIAAEMVKFSYLSRLLDCHGTLLASGIAP